MPKTFKRVGAKINKTNIMKNLEELDLRVLDASKSEKVNQFKKYFWLVSVFLLYILFMVSPSMLYSQNIDGVKKASTKQEAQTRPFSQLGEDAETNQDKTNSSHQTPLILKLGEFDWSVFGSSLESFFGSPEFWERGNYQEDPYVYDVDPCIKDCRNTKNYETGRCYVTIDDEDEQQICIELAQEKYDECASGCLGGFLP